MHHLGRGRAVAVHGVVLRFWSLLQSNVALSSAEPSRMPHWDLSVVQSSSVGIPCVGCLPMPVLVLRQGSVKLKHLPSGHISAQTAIQSSEVDVDKVPRSVNAADASEKWWHT